MAEREINNVLGAGAVFRDNSSIPLGTDFRTYLWRRLFACEVLLALIGPHWWDPIEPGGRAPVMNPDDFVRRELEAALTWNIQVIPVVTEGVGKLTGRQFPASLESLPYRQYHEVRTRSADTDLRELAHRLGDPERQSSAPSAGGVSMRDNRGIVQTGSNSQATQHFGSRPDDD
ncbi:hypothetical protein [Symbioplanes lichenis]|uniref:hypothetical protein n=1 Tax=Symbioplanes lichenis TaxID=1629072 RepID=UPI002739FBA8|nr:hypothetical protein [Actinoplanes lichenis]